MAGDNPIGRSAVRRDFRPPDRLLLRKEAQLHKRIRIEQQVQPLADRQLAAFMLLGDAFVTAHGQVLLPAGMQVRYLAGVVVTHAGILLRGPPVADE